MSQELIGHRIVDAIVTVLEVLLGERILRVSGHLMSAGRVWYVEGVVWCVEGVMCGGCGVWRVWCVEGVVCGEST